MSRPLVSGLTPPALAWRAIIRARGAARTLVLLAEEFGQAWYPGWGSWTSDETPRLHGASEKLGGSSEAAVQVAIGLAAAGWRVEVYAADLPPAAIGSTDRHGVTWLPTEWYNPGGDLEGGAASQATDPASAPREVVVCFRYFAAVELALPISPPPQQQHPPLQTPFCANGRCVDRVLVWLEDLVPGHKQLPPAAGWAADAMSVVSKVVAVSPPHAALYAPAHLAWSQLAAIPNPVRPALLPPLLPPPAAPRSNAVFAYASAPNRGLELLLDAWPLVQVAVRARAARADCRGLADARETPQLRVYYGFTAGFEQFMAGQLGAAGFAAYKRRMLARLNCRDCGVDYRGFRPERQLSAELQEAGFLLYPSSFRETGCLAALKAMGAGALPVTSRLADSVLPLLAGGIDLGPSCIGAAHNGSAEARVLGSGPVVARPVALGLAEDALSCAGLGGALRRILGERAGGILAEADSAPMGTRVEWSRAAAVGGAGCSEPPSPERYAAAVTAAVCDWERPQLDALRSIAQAMVRCWYSTSGVVQQWQNELG